MAISDTFVEDPRCYPSPSPFSPPDGRIEAAVRHAAALAWKNERRSWLRRGLHAKVRFIGRGHQWPLHPGDAIALSDAEHHELGELPAELVLHIIAHHVHAAELVAAVQRALRGDGVTVRPPATDLERRALQMGERFFEDKRTRDELRAARRTRRRK
jgi:hypothetical protein